MLSEIAPNLKLNIGEGEGALLWEGDSMHLMKGRFSIDPINRECGPGERAALRWRQTAARGFAPKVFAGQRPSGDLGGEVPEQKQSIATNVLRKKPVEVSEKIHRRLRREKRPRMPHRSGGPVCRSAFSRGDPRRSRSATFMRLGKSEHLGRSRFRQEKIFRRRYKNLTLTILQNKNRTQQDPPPATAHLFQWVPAPGNEPPI